MSYFILDVKGRKIDNNLNVFCSHDPNGACTIKIFQRYFADISEIFRRSQRFADQGEISLVKRKSNFRLLVFVLFFA